MAQLSLKTRSPSPSTTEYTVSTARSRETAISKTFYHFALLLRAFLASCSGVLLFIQCSNPSSRAWSWLRRIDGIHKSIITTCLRPEFTNEGRKWWVVASILLVILWILSRRDSVGLSMALDESLLVMRGFGIQTSTSSPSYLSTPTTRFISTSQIQDIFIHEAFIGFEVKFYLAVIVEGEDQAVVVFPKLLPKREVLEEVWRGARGVLGWSKR